MKEVTETTKQLDAARAPHFDDAQKNKLPIMRKEQMAGYYAKETWRDPDGRKWGLGEDRQGKYVRYRIFRFQSQEDCAAADGHLLKPTKWPIPPIRKMEIGGVPVMVETEQAIACEHCGVWLMAANDWETNPPPDVKLELPAKKGK